MLVRAANQTVKADDQQITDQVKQKLATDDPTMAPRIFVSTRDGVVTLMGTEVPARGGTRVIDASKSCF